MKIICVGRNYADHAKELNNEVPKEPVIFLKPETAVVPKKMPFFIPDFSEEVHYEAEVVVRINRLGKHIQEEFAHKYYNQVTLGVDFTARDVQQKCKEKGLPWEKAKAFDGSAIVGKMIDKNELDINDLNFHLEVNEKTVQSANTSEMLFSVDKIIAYVSKYFTLKIGDLIFTGTPAGVGKIYKNDSIKGFLSEREVFTVNVK